MFHLNTRVFLVVPALTAAFAEAQVTRYVNASCGNDSWSGLSPACAAPTGAKRTIQAAINASVSGDTVLVAAGTYLERITFGGRNITVRGAGIGLSIIDGAALDTVVKFNSGETPAAVLRDVSIRNGGVAPAGTQLGGGMLIMGCSPTIMNCEFAGNLGSGTMVSAGGIKAVGSSSTVLNCRFTGNSADPAGAVHLSGAVVLINCYMRGNTGFSNTVVVSGGTATMINCTVANNTSTVGSGVQVAAGSMLKATNCIFWQNHGSPPFAEITGPATVTFSDIDGGFAGAGNINVNPQLSGFQIATLSPCVDSGDKSVFASSGDILGQPRAVTTRLASGGPWAGPLIDMGCFEVQPCYANCDNSTIPPILNINDFTCFIARYAAGCP